MWPARCAEGGDGGCGDDLDRETGVHDHAEQAVSRGGVLFCAHDALVYADIWSCSAVVVGDCEGGDAVDARQGAEDKEFVFGGMRWLESVGTTVRGTGTCPWGYGSLVGGVSAGTSCCVCTCVVVNLGSPGPSGSKAAKRRQNKFRPRRPSVIVIFVVSMKVF